MTNPFKITLMQYFMNREAPPELYHYFLDNFDQEALDEFMDDFNQNKLTVNTMMENIYAAMDETFAEFRKVKNGN